jgi:hypothetical protein
MPSFLELDGLVAIASSVVHPDARTAVHFGRTDAYGSATFDGLSPGPIYVDTPEISLLVREMAPWQPIIPAHDSVRITADSIYVIARRTPDDEVDTAYITKYDGRLEVIIGEKLRLLQEIGGKKLGGGLCLPVVRRLGTSEVGISELEIPGMAVLRKRGAIPFRFRPIPYEDIATAPSWEYPNSAQPRLESSEVVIKAADPVQAGIISSISADILTLTSSRSDLIIHIAGRAPSKVPAGEYRCEGATGVFKDLVECPNEVTVTPGAENAIPVRLKEVVVPLRVHVVNEQGVEYQVGLYRFEYRDRSKAFGGIETGGFNNRVHWLLGGRVTLKIQTGPGLSIRAQEEIDLGINWTDQISDYYLMVK